MNKLKRILGTRDWKQCVIVLVVVTALSFTACTVKVDPEYFGTWNNGPYYSTFTITADNYVETYTAGHPLVKAGTVLFAMDNLEWKPIKNKSPISTYTEQYPTGYVITGTLTEQRSNSPFSENDIGTRCSIYLYISGTTSILYSTYGNVTEPQHAIMYSKKTNEVFPVNEW